MKIIRIVMLRYEASIIKATGNLLFWQNADKFFAIAQNDIGILS
jgi:hypothetical protein